MPTFKAADRIFETSETTGAGDYDLDGAPIGFQAFSVMGANNLCSYFAEDGVNWEVGVGTILAAPARLARTTILASSNGGAAVNWGAGTKNIRCGLPASLAAPRFLSKSVAGGAGTTVLTQDEQRRDIIELTGALTGNRTIEVDATPWRWIVYNNTSGNFSLTLKVTGQAGVVLAQGQRHGVHCDGIDVRANGADFSPDGEYRSTVVFTGSGTWNKPAGLKRVVVTVVAGGGSGGGSAATTAGQGAAAGGGAGGGAALKTISAASLGATETVTVGAGGAAPSAGENAGNTGGTSSFGAHCSATGGAGGTTGPNSTTTGGGRGADGGIGSGGDLNIAGSCSFGGWRFASSSGDAVGGNGGSSIFGGGARSGNSSGNGQPGRNYGGGGSGSLAGASQSAFAGGAGAAGIVIVEEFF